MWGQPPRLPALSEVEGPQRSEALYRQNPPASIPSPLT